MEHSPSSTPIYCTIVLIAGDRDYSYLISTLRLRNHKVILIYPPGSTSKNLNHLATAILDWRKDVAECSTPGQRLKTLLPKAEGPASVSPNSSVQIQAPTPSSKQSKADNQRQVVPPPKSKQTSSSTPTDNARDVLRKDPQSSSGNPTPSKDKMSQ